MTGDVQPYTQKQEKFGSWIISKVGRWQTTVYELTGGRLWNTFLGGPVAILTTVGRKSGQVRKVPLLYLRHGDEVVMTASKGGMSKLPIWYFNVVAADTVDIQIGSVKRPTACARPTPMRRRCCGRSWKRCTPTTRSIGRARKAFATSPC
ncbi:MAG: nitroreductase family deazaflavin-dependent oxidoreductase [Haliea sp.]|nr:nitroreductase family deazaflavin-dependent oxidoreductase [Haliea sp.]